LGKKKKVKKIVEGIMKNKGTDILITGGCYDNITGEKVSIEIIALFKTTKVIESKKIEFKKEKLIKASHDFKNKRLLKKDELANKFISNSLKSGREDEILNEIEIAVWRFFTTIDTKIEKDVKDMMDELSKPGKSLAATPQGQKIYVTNLSFMDAQTLSTMVQTEMAASIDEAVIKGMEMGQKANDDLLINAPGHRIPNTDANVNKFLNVSFDPNLPKNQKIDRIIQEIMIPNHADVIVTGHYIDAAKNPLVIVRPIMIVKSQRRILSKNLQFKREELRCRNPVSKKRVLCPVAFAQIARAVKELLEQL